MIENGKHYAFVGVNGAGKTTIAKLITGLYTNYEGEILVDGRPLRSMSGAEIKGLSSVVYQDFARYYIPMYDNIALGCLNQEHDRTDIENAAEAAGLSHTISRLPDGLDTPLGKIQEKGVDISGGEWQRIAIARGLYRVHDIIVLDEPTAAIDPLEESRIYRKFVEISRGKTAIIVTHRLGSTKIADRVIVMEKGRVIATGTHDELMRNCELYRTMYDSQAEWYTEKPLNNGAGAETAAG